MDTTSVPTLQMNDGRTIPQLGFGVFLVPPEEAADAVTHALQTGYRSIDTAAMYRNERGVGEAIRASGIPREDLFVTTKVWPSDYGRAETPRALERSLEQLGDEYVDLYLLHWPAPAIGKYVEAYEALVELRDRGLTRSIGVSNFFEEHLAKVIDATGAVPAVNQVELHPRFEQRELRAYHEQHGILTEAWSPLGRGAILDDPAVTGIASDVGRTPAQVVLRWHLQLGNVVIPKSVTPARIEQNFDVFDFELSAEQVAAIEQLDDDAGRIGPDPASFNGS
ncbi:MAG TPA: aldo/keto reductase [Solirubrobacteraceae bacterium]|jgi:2,5-diketo-D-gluconate reductase A|nr:aldo/keto reductase [Solirubrobacteraceae bacterium]